MDSDEHSDSFYALEGEVELHVRDEVVSESPARMLDLRTPGGVAGYMRERATLAEQGLEPDAAFFERHDIYDV